MARCAGRVESTTKPTFSIYGTVTGGTLSPAPSTPEQVRYADWSYSIDSAWDFPVTGGAQDSAILYFWGYNAPLTLAAGASVSYTQYVSTVLGAVGGGTATTTATAIPTLTEWGMILLSGLLGLGAAHTMRRRIQGKKTET